jgi:hypothetical protein
MDTEGTKVWDMQAVSELCFAFAFLVAFASFAVKIPVFYSLASAGRRVCQSVKLWYAKAAFSTV